MYPDCLKDLVGLTHNHAQCLDGTQISNVTTLDLFVSQDPAYDNCRLKGGDTQCELIKLMADMREEALRQITVDIGAIMLSKVKARQDCHYFIGQNEFGSDYASNLVPAQPSLDINTEYRPGAFIRLDKIALMIYPKTGTITVPLLVYRVYADNDLELLHTFQIPVNRRVTTPMPYVGYTIPCDGYTYRIMYNFNSETMTVPDSNYHCSCGNKLRCAQGFIKENISKTYGISLYATLFCESGQAICSLLNNDTYRMVVGFMIRKLTIKLLLEKIYNRQEVNKYTLLSAEDTVAQIESYGLEYNSRLDWISQQRDFDYDGFCLMCDSGGARKFNLLTGR